jgi:hypothetical protein
VIAYARDHFVPVALNLYHIRVESTPAGDFFRSVQRQRPAQYQGLYIVAPDGKVLASHQDFKSEKTWPQEVLEVLKAGVAAFGGVTSRPAQVVDDLPYRGLGTRPDGSVRLAVSIRYMFSGTRKEGLSAVVLDSLPLTREEWGTLAPPKNEPGTSWTVPEAVARKFFPVLSPTEMLFRDPGEVTAVQLTARVRSVDNGVLHVEYEGRIAGIHHGTANEGKKGKACHGEARLIGGAGAFDVATRNMQSLTLVFSGTFSAFPPYDRPANPYGAVVEWWQAVAVRGMVRYDGKPVETGTISFTPVNTEQKTVGPSATGPLRGGKYSLTGVTPGMNRVHVAIGEEKDTVTGRVSFGGKPLTKGTFTLVPVDNQGKPSGPELKGSIQDGQYQVKGVGKGSYRITVSIEEPEKRASEGSGQKGAVLVSDGVAGNDRLIFIGKCDQTLDLELRPAPLNKRPSGQGDGKR